MTTAMERVRADLVLAINEHIEREDVEHIGGLMWAAGEASRLIEIDERWGRNEEANHEPE